MAVGGWSGWLVGWLVAGLCDLVMTDMLEERQDAMAAMRDRFPFATRVCRPGL